MGLDRRLHRAAGASVLAHLTDLIGRGLVAAEAGVGADQKFRLISP